MKFSCGTHDNSEVKWGGTFKAGFYTQLQDFLVPKRVKLSYATTCGTHDKSRKVFYFPCVPHDVFESFQFLPNFFLTFHFYELI